MGQSVRTVGAATAGKMESPRNARDSTQGGVKSVWQGELVPRRLRGE